MVRAPVATLEYEANEEKPLFKHRRCWLMDETVGLAHLPWTSTSRLLFCE